MRSITRRARERHPDPFSRTFTEPHNTYSGFGVPSFGPTCENEESKWSPPEADYNYNYNYSEQEQIGSDYEDKITFKATNEERVTVSNDKTNGHCRNPSTVTTESKINKRFSVHPQSQSQQLQSQTQPLSPSSNMTEVPLPKYESTGTLDVVGEEPGINIDTMEVHIPDGVGSQVTIVDYSNSDCQITRYDVPKGHDSVISGSSDRRMLDRRLDEAIAERPTWGQVRWIVVNGLSWEALRPIAAYYKLHPLALEDVLDIPQRTKVEVHHEQIFCCFPMHTLHITPTPFSFLHHVFRQCVIKIYQVIVGIRSLCLWIARLITSACYYVRTCSSGVHSSSGKDAEQQKEHQCSKNICTGQGNAPSMQQSFFSSDNSDSCISKSCIDNSVTTTFPSGVYASRKWGDSSSTLVEEEECIPFFTSNNGTLCSNTEATPVEAFLRELPARSMYEWNCGNLALHNEALQNMRVQGSPNSVEIAIEQVSVFLVSNTVITIFERDASAVYDPIQKRLMSPLTLLRQSNDASVLMQAIFDASVDLVRPILHEYRSQLSRLQVEGVHQPNLRHTRALHAFMTELTMMRTLVRSLGSLVDALRLKSVWVELNVKKSEANPTVRDHNPVNKPISAKPISAKAVEYLSDVADHAKAYLEDLDGMYAQSQTLNSLIFDTISIRAGDSVKMLSLVSVIFLPLTFLTGYFGMNFKSFTTLNHDVGYYWLVSTPAAAALTVFLMYPTAVSQIQEWWSWAKLQV